MFDRRELMAGAGAVVAGLAAADRSSASAHSAERPNCAKPVDAEAAADARIVIAPGVLELGKEVAVSTKLYNGVFPGPLIRLTEGKPCIVEVQNKTDAPE